MRTLVLLLLGALCVLGAPRRAEAEPPPPTRQALDKAIERGLDWLLAEQRPVGTWGSGKHALGKTALATYALLHCGLAEDQGTPQARRLARALKFLDREGAGRSTRRERDTRTYEASLLLMILRARGRPEDRDRMQRLARLLVSTQTKSGQWWYDGERARLRSGGDNSNTQFAMLALGVAHGEGLAVDRGAMLAAQRWWTTSPGTHGGFGYASGGSARSAATGSMTAAGIACLAITEAVLAVPDRAADAGHAPTLTEAARVRAAATAFLASVFSLTKNHGPAIDRKQQRQRQGGRGWLHYYLWTIERAMVLSGQERLGGIDWYADGARHLLATQKDDGSWRGEHPLYATCFALLFLTRAADRPRAFTPRAEPARPGVATGPTVTGPQPDAKPEEGPAGEPPPERLPLPPGTVLDWLQAKLPLGELPWRCRQAGAGSLLPVVEALLHPEPAVRRRAFEALRALLPEARTERVDRHPLPRGRLALWLRINARHLILAQDRFVEP